jgi:hypothetical protein
VTSEYGELAHCPDPEKVPALSFQKGDPPTKLFTDPDFVISLVGEGKGVLLFDGVPIKDVAEVFLGVGKLLHQAASNDSARRAILEAYGVVSKVSHGVILNADEVRLLQEAPQLLSSLVPCQDPACPFCHGPSDPGGN